MPNIRTTLSLIAGVALVAALWLALRHRAAERPATQAVATPRVAASAPLAVPAEPTPRARLATAQAQLHGNGRDLCSLAVESQHGPASGAALDDDDDAARTALARTPAFQAFEEGMRHIDGALRSSPDPYANAVAIWLNIPRNEQDDGAVSESERRRELAAMATATTDPRLYALAFRTCDGSTADGCHALNARRWAELDAGNATPWVFLLDEAVSRADLSGQQEAWFHLAAAKRADDRTYTQLSPIIANSDGSAGSLMAAQVLSSVAIGTAAAWRSPSAPMDGCRAAALADANRAQLCARFADVMFEHSDTLLTRLFGAGITLRLTGDATRKATVGAEIDQDNDAWSRPSVPNCDTLRASLVRVSRYAAVGQPAAARERAAAPPSR